MRFCGWGQAKRSIEFRPNQEGGSFSSPFPRRFFFYFSFFLGMSHSLYLSLSLSLFLSRSLSMNKIGWRFSNFLECYDLKQGNGYERGVMQPSVMRVSIEEAILNIQDESYSINAGMLYQEEFRIFTTFKVLN